MPIEPRYLVIKHRDARAYLTLEGYPFSVIDFPA